MLGLEDECEGALELLQDRLDELSEGNALVGLRVVNVFREDSYRLGIRVALELVSALGEDHADFIVVGNDAVVYDAEFGRRIGLEGMAVDLRRNAVRRPASMRDRDLGVERLVDIDVGGSDLLAQAGDLAYVLEEDDLAGLVAVDAQTSRVITAIFLAR